MEQDKLIKTSMQEETLKKLLQIDHGKINKTAVF